MPCNKKLTKKETELVKKISNKIKKGEVEVEVVLGTLNGVCKGNTLILPKTEYLKYQNQLKLL